MQAAAHNDGHMVFSFQKCFNLLLLFASLLISYYRTPVKIELGIYFAQSILLDFWIVWGRQGFSPIILLGTQSCGKITLCYLDWKSFYDCRWRPQKFFSLTHTLFAVTWKRWCALAEGFIVMEFTVKNSKMVLRVKMFKNLVVVLGTYLQNRGNTRKIWKI